jgi:ABC-type glutathione transport system ATPase component
LNRDALTTTTPLLEAKNIRKEFRSGGKLFGSKAFVALDDVSLTIAPREVVALVGESGSGKSTLGRILARLDAATSGTLALEGRDVDVRGDHVARDYRRAVQMVFQDPFASLNPMVTVFDHIARPLARLLGTKATADRVYALLESVGLSPPRELAAKLPHALSGGQRQRVAIARALAVEPRLLIADEPTSMLDVSIRMGVLELLEGLRRDHGLSVLFITHDLASARHVASRALVLHHGRVVESASIDDVIERPSHTYTKALLAAAPGRRLHADTTHPEKLEGSHVSFSA